MSRIDEILEEINNDVDAGEREQRHYHRHHHQDCYDSRYGYSRHSSYRGRDYDDEYGYEDCYYDDWYYSDWYYDEAEYNDRFSDGINDYYEGEYGNNGNQRSTEERALDFYWDHQDEIVGTSYERTSHDDWEDTRDRALAYYYVSHGSSNPGRLSATESSGERTAREIADEALAYYYEHANEG